MNRFYLVVVGMFLVFLVSTIFAYITMTEIRTQLESLKSEFRLYRQEYLQVNVFSPRTAQWWYLEFACCNIPGTPNHVENFPPYRAVATMPGENARLIELFDSKSQAAGIEYFRTLGERGWELVAVAPERDSANRTVYLFKQYRGWK